MSLQYFFGVGPVVLQMEIDCLRNFHSAPPVDLRNDVNGLHFIVPQGQEVWLVTRMGIRNNVNFEVFSQAEACRGKSILLNHGHSNTLISVKC